MTEWCVRLSDSLTEQLAASFHQGPVVEIRGGVGLRLLAEKTVDRFNGVKAEVFSNEHPPPHFRVKYQSSTANYAIADCTRLNGKGEVLRYEKNIILWWKQNKQALIETWNRLRPSDCPVGEYVEKSGGGK